MKKTLITVALLAAAASASATTYDWGPHNATAEANSAFVAAGSFSDVYTFSLSLDQQVASSVVSLNLSPVYSITGASYSLWLDKGVAGVGGGDEELGSWAFDGTTGSTSHTLNVASGNYYYLVTGTADGMGDGNGRAGFYTIASTVVPVPEPETYALMMAGLFVVGGAFARRAKRS